MAIGTGITARPDAASAAIAPPPGFSYNFWTTGPDVYLVPAGGGAPQIVGQSSGHHCWSPDGSRVAVVLGFGGTADSGLIESRRIGGSNSVRASFPVNAGDGFPAYTPDGRWIVYARTISAGTALRLWWSSSDGLWDRGDLFPGFNLHCYEPAISSRGVLAFTATGGAYEPSHIYTSQLTGSGWSEPRLTIEGGARPRFSPDGTKIAYGTPLSAYGPLREIWVADVDGANGFKVSPADRDSKYVDPVWSPDGAYLYLERTDVQETFERIPALSPGAAEALTVRGRFAAFRPTARNTVMRAWGNLALDTAVAVSQSMWASAGDPSDTRAKADAVVLSRSDVFYDALAGSALAANKRAPLLITPREGLYGPTEAEIKRVAGTGGLVYLLGGEAAMPKPIENRLVALGFRVVRLAGETMFETAIAIAREITEDPAAVFVATGLEYYDALAAGAAAGSGAWGKAVVILTDGDRLPPASAAYLDKIDPSRVDVVLAGGPGMRAVVNDAWRGGKLPSWPDRIEYYDLTGATAVETALLLAQATFASPQQVALATMDGWYDALTGGAMIGARGGPLLLTPPSALHANVAAYLNNSSASIHTAFMLGGTAALPQHLAAPIGDNIGVPGLWDYSDTKPMAQGGSASGDAIRPARKKQAAQR